MASTLEYYNKASKAFFRIIDMIGGEHSVNDYEEHMRINWLPTYSLLMMSENKELSTMIEWAELPKGILPTQAVMEYLHHSLDDNERKIFLKMQGDAFTGTIEEGDPFDFVEDFVDYVGWERKEVKGYANEILKSKNDKYKVVKNAFNLYQEMLLLFTPDKVSDFIQENFIFNGKLPPGAKFWDYEQLAAINVLCTGLFYNMNEN